MNDMRLLRAAIPALFMAASLAAAEQPPPAASLMEKGKAEAAASHRAIFVVFHASW
jgi:hypothetical protein